MEILTRQMEPGEESQVQRVARRAFGGLEGLFLTKPKGAVVAVHNGKIIGAIQYKFYKAGGKKVGYYDYAFIDPDYHNKGVGGILYKAAAEYLWGQGCDALSAAVKDDNVGSWSLFLKNGFSRISLPELTRQFGFTGMLRLYFGSLHSIAIGMDYYVALRDRPCPSGKGSNTKQIASYLLVNLALFLVMALRAKGNISAFFLAYLILLVGGILAGYVGTLFTKRKWHFRLCNGGGLVCALVNFSSGAYPMIGNWYPDRYENTDGFRRDMGVNALAGWLFVLVLSALTVLGGSKELLSQSIGQIGSLFLLYRILAIYPFESFGGKRVFLWNKWVYGLLAVPSIAIFAAAFIW